MRRIVWLVVLLASFLVAGRTSAATYYISSSTGSDANTAVQAQSKSTPWAHLPCMANATSNAAAYTPVAGDSFILKGGDSWLNASFPCTWTWSGTNGNVITIGVDQTWYTGGSWIRPVWDAGSAVISGAKNAFLNLSNQSYVTLDNVEMKGFYWTGAPAYGTCAHILTTAGTNLTLDHLYIHGWGHGTYASGTRDDSCYIVQGDTNSPFVSGSVLQNSVIDGSDSTGGGDSNAATYSFPSIKNTVIHDMPNMLLPIHSGEISGNLLYNCTNSFDAATHNNFLQTLQGAGPNGTFYIHNNVIHDGVLGCQTGFFGNPGEIDYVWNNVWYNIGSTLATTQNVDPGIAMYFWNNTIVPLAGNYCLRLGHPGSYSVVEFRNNHCITTAASATDPALSATTLTIDHNVLQTPTVASAQGYTSAQTYAYSLTSAAGATVEQGVNLISSCTGSLASLCNDTTYGAAYNASSHSVSGPGRTAVSRPSSGAWDVGAYQRGQPPVPPTGLTVQ